jgi:hypothetical protein
VRNKKVDSPKVKAALGSPHWDSAGSRVPIIIAIVVVGVVFAGVMLFRGNKRPKTDGSMVRSTATTSVAAVTATNVTNSTSTSTSAPVAAPKPDPRTLVATLAQIDLSGGPITPEKAAAWKETWHQLTQLGPTAVPAISEFLERRDNLNFESVSNGTLLGHPTLRLALLAALGRIGGPEATAALAQTLPATTDPREIAALASYLQAAAPGQHLPTLLDVARKSLALAADGKLEGQDTGPLFGLFQQWGGTNVLSDLTNAMPQWKYYAAITLANLPNGEGVATLVQLASVPEMPKATQAVALQMLAQIAAQYSAARTALVERARANQIPEPTWAEIASVLGGHSFQIGNPAADSIGSSPGGGNVKRYHLAFGNQNFYSGQAVANWPAEQVNLRLAIIDELLGATSNVVAGDVLGKTRALLVARVQP